MSRWEKQTREIQQKKSAKMQELKQREQVLMKLKEEHNEFLDNVVGDTHQYNLQDSLVKSRVRHRSSKTIGD